MTEKANTRLGIIIDEIEETSIALCLGAMTLLTFANVVARYVFNSNILWALEVTVFLFAWLVLMGASYCVKKYIHIGVDVVITHLSTAAQKLCSLLSVGACLLFSALLLVGSWEYWYPFVTERAWLETEDIPMPDTLQFLADWLNEGERYEKVPRFIPYLALPLSIALLTIRFLQVGMDIIRGERHMVIASHEVSDVSGADSNRQRED